MLSPSLIHCYPLMVGAPPAAWSRTSTATSSSTARPASPPRRRGTATRRVTTAIPEQADLLIHICGTDFHYQGYGALCAKLAQRCRSAGARRRGRLADLPHQLGDRGGGGGHQDRAPPHQALAAHRLPRRLPWPQPGLAVADGVQVQVPQALRPAALGRPPRRATATPAASTRAVAHGGARGRRRNLRRASAGRGRLLVPPARVPGGAAPALRPPRHPAGVRRGAVGDGPHRHHVRGRALRRGARHHRAGQGAGLGHAARRDDGAEALHDLAVGLARLDLRREPGRIAAALATIELLENELLANTKQVGAHLKQLLDSKLRGIPPSKRCAGSG